MAKKFEHLENQMNPERLAQAKAQAKEVMAEMLLAEIRKEAGFTQEEIAKTIGIKQTQWKAFLNRSMLSETGLSLENVLESLKSRIWPLLQKAKK